MEELLAKIAEIARERDELRGINESLRDHVAVVVREREAARARVALLEAADSSTRERDELRNEVECLTALSRALARDLDATRVLARKFNAMMRALHETN